MTDIVERLEHYAVCAMPHYPNDLCSQAKREIERLRAASEWRDISTAPRDGISVLLDAPEGVGEAQRSAPDFRWTWADGEYVCGEPTHYMPLPAPPQRNEVTK